MTDILIDTDIGGDIDDTLAIALALNSPELDVKGITTLFTGVDQRTQLVIRLLETFGFGKIPVVRGVEKPLFGTWDPSLIPHQSMILEKEIPYDRSRYAPEFLIEQVMQNENMTIAAIGPLTNVALAIAGEPRIAQKAQLLMMGGMISAARAEWNIACDPEAARLVFESGIPITMVGLDVTLRCSLDMPLIDRIRKAGTEKTDFLAKLIDIFLKTFDFLPVLHDPLAVAVLQWPELMKFEKKRICVETRGEFTRGFTVDCTAEGKAQEGGCNALVCTDVDEKRFVELLMERLLK